MKMRKLLFILIIVLSLVPFTALLIKSINKNTTSQLLVAEEMEIPESPSEKPLVNEKSATASVQADKTPKIEYPKSNNRKSPIGINANEIFEQDSSIPFIDLMRVATPFHENIRCRAQDRPCLTSAKVQYDDAGWPNKLNGGTAGVFFLRNVQ